MLVFLSYIQPPLKRDREIVKTFHVEFSFWIPEFFCIFQSEATDNGIPVILNLFNVEYIEPMDSELRGPASTLLDIVDIVSRATSVYYFHPSPPSNVVYRQCVHAILHTNIEREEGGAVSCVPINVSVWGVALT